MLVYAAIAWRWGTLHLFISACVAPALLLRNEDSINLGLRLGASFLARGPGSFLNWLSKKLLKGAKLSPIPRGFLIRSLIFALLGMLTIAILIPASFLVSRFLATLISLIRSPFKSLGGLPRNWWNIIAETDSRLPPELLLGYTGPGEEISKPTLLLAGIWRGVNEEKGLRNRIPKYIGSAVLSTATLPLFAIALAYRWSIKGTALLWMPLLWTIRGALHLPLRQQLLEVREAWLHRAVRLYSAFILLALLAKFWLFSLTTTAAERCSETLGSVVCQHIVIPGAIPPWQWAAGLNALLSWVLFLCSDLLLVRLTHGIASPGEGWNRAIKGLWLFRGVLTIYTVACTIYIMAVLSERWRLPPLGEHFVPW